MTTESCTWPLSACSIVGACSFEDGRAPFERADVVLCRGDARDVLLIARSFCGTSAAPFASGDTLTHDEFEELLSSGEAIHLTEIPAEPWVALWSFRPSFGEPLIELALQDLESRGASVSVEREHRQVRVMVREKKGAEFRQRWARNAIAEACQRRELFPRDDASILTAAERAFALDGQSPAVIATLATAYTLVGRAGRAEALLKSARASLPHDAVLALDEHLRATPASSHASEGRSRRSQPIASARHCRFERTAAPMLARTGT